MSYLICVWIFPKKQPPPKKRDIRLEDQIRLEDRHLNVLYQPQDLVSHVGNIIYSLPVPLTSLGILSCWVLRVPWLQTCVPCTDTAGLTSCAGIQESVLGEGSRVCCLAWAVSLTEQGPDSVCKDVHTAISVCFLLTGADGTVMFCLEKQKWHSTVRTHTQELEQALK